VIVAVIGKEARKVKREGALEDICLQGLYHSWLFGKLLSPELTCKNCDSLYPIGSWLVDTNDIKDFSNLTMKTHVNRELTQEGSTSDMIFMCHFNRIFKQLYDAKIRWFNCNRHSKRT